MGLHAGRKALRSFGPARLSLGVAVIMLAGLAGMQAWHQHRRGTGAAVSSTAGQAWQTFCSDYGALCLQYPKTWRQKTYMSDASDAISPETTTITSPSGKTVVTYRPNFGISNRKEAVIMSVVSVDVTRSDDLHVVSLIDAYNGSGLPDKPYSAEEFVTNNLLSAIGAAFTPGQRIESDFEPVFHVFTPRNNSKISSYLYVKYDQSEYNEVPSQHFTYQQALDQLNETEAKTAHMILKTARYRD